MDSIKPIKIKATVFYPQDMSKINKTFDEDNKKYSCTLGNLSEAACKALEELGIKIKDKEVPSKHIVGKSLYKFNAVTPEGEEIAAENIGSGTEVEVLLTAYRHKLSAKHGAAPSVKKLIVTKLQAYDPAGSVADADAPAL
jgi:hypothetical protein